MSNPSQGPSAARIEGIEAAAWGDIFRVSGLTVQDLNGALALHTPEVRHPDMNRVIGLGVAAPATEDLLEQAIAIYPEGFPCFLQIVPNSDPPELHQWIIARGFQPQRRWVQLWRPLHGRPRQDVAAPATLPPVHIEPVARTRASIFTETMCEGFRFPALVGTYLDHLVERPGWHAYLAFVGDYEARKVAGAGLMHIHNGSAYLALGCALPSFRGQGVQAALIERRVSDAHAAGADIVVTEAAEDIPEKPNPSLHNLIRLGFREAYKRCNYQRA